MLKKLILLLVFLVPCFTAHGSYAQATFCTQDAENVAEKMAEYGEVFLFSGISKMGVPYLFYAGKRTYTVIIMDPNRGYCTTPHIFGDIIEMGDNVKLPETLNSL